MAKENQDVYLDLSDPSVFRKLSKKEKKYVLAQERIYKEKVRLENYYENLTSDIEKRNAITRQQYILSGQAYKEAQRIFYENYSKGLRKQGQAGAANLLDFLVHTHKGERWRDSLYNDLPVLDLFYADKRSTTGDANKDKQTVGDNPATYADVKEALIERAEQYGLSDKVINYLLTTTFKEDDSPANYTRAELRYLADDK